MKLKASDYSCIPLCHDHHTQASDSIHRVGKTPFELRHDVNLRDVVKRLNRLWFDPQNRVA
jgi:hypothetical protein